MSCHLCEAVPYQLWICSSASFRLCRCCSDTIYLMCKTLNPDEQSKWFVEWDVVIFSMGLE